MQIQEVGMIVEFRRLAENGYFLALCWFFEAIREELCYHARGSRTAFQIRRTRKSRATFERLPITIVLSFANRFALSPNDDDSLCRFGISGHLQDAVVAIVLSRQFDVEEIAVGKSANGFRYHNDILSKAGHRSSAEKTGELEHIVISL